MSHNEPKVTGLSPAEGSPGTKVTVRGENLGKGQDDLVSVYICGVDCTMFSEWKSSHKVVTRTRFCSGVGDVIITTKSGGKGSCTVQFKGVNETISPTVESAVWVDESHLFNTPYVNLKGPSSSSQLKSDSNLLGTMSHSSPSHTPMVASLSEAELKHLFPGKCNDIFSSGFSPEWYLLQNHMSTSFEDLKSGLKELERRVGAQQEGPSTFLKSNVNGIVVCLDVLQDLNRMIHKDKTDLGASHTHSLSINLEKSHEEAVHIFEDILSRKDASDSMRTSLGILHKFRFLFNLPAQIEHNVKQGDYDVVISDYARAKSVFKDTQVAIFKRVFLDIERRVDKFKAQLKHSISQFPAPLEERKKLIGYLIQLDPDSNPGWEAIEHNHAWLMNQLETIKLQHVDKALHSKTMEDTPYQVQYVQTAATFFSTHYPDFSKLLSSYNNGEIYGVHMLLNDTDQQQKEGIDMILKMVSKLCWEIRCALLPSHSLKVDTPWPTTSLTSLGPWLPACLRSVGNIYSCLLKLDTTQANTLNQVQLLIFNLREHAMISLFNQATQDITKLHEQETWQLNQDDDNGGSSQLPLLFENRVLEALEMIRQNVLQSSGSQMFSQVSVQTAIKQNVQNLISAFVETLEKAALNSTGGSLGHINGSGLKVERERKDLCVEDKLLMSLSNISYTRRLVLPHLQTAFNSHQYPDITTIIKNGDILLEDLDDKLLNKLIKLMQSPLVSNLERLMQEHKFEYSTDKQPSDVSTYLKEVLLDLTEIHYKVFSVSASLVPRVLPSVVDALLQELARLYGDVRHFPNSGNLQIALDLRVLEDTLQCFNVNNNFDVLRPCKQRLISDNKRHQDLIDELLSQFRFHQRLQIMCFK